VGRDLPFPLGLRRKEILGNRERTGLTFIEE